MKKLQNNFTTPEQSKRLLELGLPANSADCYLFKDSRIYNGVRRPFSLFPNTYKYVEKFNGQFGNEISPCWSVGRLIEILMICNTYFAPKVFQIEPNSMNPSLIENVVDKIEELKGYDMLDFSKLEE